MKITLDVNINEEIIGYIKGIIQNCQVNINHGAYKVPGNKTNVAPIEVGANGAGPAKPEGPITIEALRAIFTEKMREGKQKEIKNLLSGLGVNKLTDLPEGKYALALDLICGV
ncbi:MAG: hypothetical protein LBV08_02585 [Clostridiales bacterium]|jgi:hypothetical protein|nr:hypothetical protein [Clostridiales bacterium]